MRIIAQSTNKIVTLETAELIEARIWEATTEGGVKCHLYVTRIAVAEGENQTEFQRELHEHKPMSPAVQAIPLRMVL